MFRKKNTESQTALGFLLDTTNEIETTQRTSLQMIVNDYDEDDICKKFKKVAMISLLSSRKRHTIDNTATVGGGIMESTTGTAVGSFYGLVGAIGGKKKLF